MGVDLALLVEYSVNRDSFSISQTRLECWRRRELFEAIRELEKLHGVPVPRQFHAYAREQYENTQTTQYGDKLQMLMASDFVAFEKHSDVLDSDVNRAVWAYLRALNPETRVALYWH
jgi:hypothetical protein